MENMDSQPRRRCRFPLRMKLVAVLIPLMVISMAVAMWGLNDFLKEFFQRRAELETARLGQVVELALRQAMLRTPDLALNATLADVGQTSSIRRVWVIDKNGRIAHASEQGVTGQVLNKAQDSICKVCHVEDQFPQRPAPSLRKMRQALPSSVMSDRLPTRRSVGSATTRRSD